MFHIHCFRHPFVSNFSVVVLIRVPMHQHVFIPLQGPSTTQPKPSGSDIAAEAENHINSTEYSYIGCHRPGCNTWKCNSFVADMIEAVGATLPHRYVRMSH